MTLNDTEFNSTFYMDVALVHDDDDDDELSSRQTNHKKFIQIGLFFNFFVITRVNQQWADIPRPKHGRLEFWEVK